MDVELLKRTKIDYILTHRRDIITDATVINHVNTGSDHGMVMNIIKLDVEVEMKQLMTKNNIDTMSEIITHMIQQSASRIAKAINNLLKSRI